MKCDFASAFEKQKKTDVCDHLGNKWLDFVEAITANGMHEIFGWGLKRIGDMYDGSAILLDEFMSLYASKGEDIWDTTLTANDGLAVRLLGIGVDFDKWVEEMPIVDRFGDSWRTEKDKHQHDFRDQWISTMEKKLMVYWATLMLWLNYEKKLGAIKLKRLFVYIRTKYVKFAEMYLMTRENTDRSMVRMIELEVEKAKKILHEEGEKKPFVSVEEFMKQYKAEQFPEQRTQYEVYALGEWGAAIKH